MEQTECSETSAYKIQTPGNHPKESIQQTQWLLSIALEKTLVSFRLRSIYRRRKVPGKAKCQFVSHVLTWAIQTDSLAMPRTYDTLAHNSQPMKFIPHGRVFFFVLFFFVFFFFVYTYGYGDSFQRQVEFSRLKTNLNQQNLARRQAIFLLILFTLILHFIPCKGSDWWFSKPTREIYKMLSSLSAVGTKPVELYYWTCRIKVSEQGAEENMWIQDEGMIEGYGTTI